VLRVDKEKGYIDLSKRRVSPEDIARCEERYMKSKSVASILRYVARNGGGEPAVDKAVRVRRTKGEGAGDEPAVQEEAPPAAGEEERMEMLYETVAWPLAKVYGHPYDAFKLALTCVPLLFYFVLIYFILSREPETVFANLPSPMSENIHVLLTTTIARRLTPQPIKLRADIELTCYTPAGIDAIKRALRSGEQASTDTVPIKAKLVAPPLYVLRCVYSFLGVERS
jgi:translation initiation factor 2 subunit 1